MYTLDIGMNLLSYILAIAFSDDFGLIFRNLMVVFCRLQANLTGWVTIKFHLYNHTFIRACAGTQTYTFILKQNEIMFID